MPKFKQNNVGRPGIVHYVNINLNFKNNIPTSFKSIENSEKHFQNQDSFTDLLKISFAIQIQVAIGLDFVQVLHLF